MHNDIADMGVSKLRFWHPKNYERKKYAVRSLPISISLSKHVMAYRVSVPLCLITPPELVVSLPIASSYRECPVRNLSHLQSRLTRETGSLPDDWINLTQSHPSPEKIVLAKFNLHSILGAPAFVIIIDDNFTWTLACYGVLVDKVECRALDSLPDMLTCLQDVSRALHIVSTGQLCAGNATTEFQTVVDMNNGGAFKDRAGTNIVVIKAHCPHALATTTSVIIILLQESKLLTKIHCHCNSQQSDRVPVNSFCHQAAKVNAVQHAHHFDPI